MPNSFTSQLETVLPAITQKQEQILQGAIRVFLREGYARTSMDRVSAEAGVAKQTIYSHFRDKEGLFKALMERLTLTCFQSIFSNTELHGEPESLLRQVGETYLTKVAENPDYLALLRLIITEAQNFPELAKLYNQTVVQRGRLLLSQYFASHPELGITDPEAIAHIFMGSLVSYVIIQEMLYGKELMDLSRDRLLDSLMNLVMSQSR
ncbi:TetR family transcriptional regulator [Nostoc sp. HK-01]|uniref:TetR family transcriptional regulator n=2 Tax=Nostocales TaxID=1161 RepID=A0A1Z4GC71_9CYAN|nr:TetR/AcrR family transcriptional regulator [Nostoc cycadae]BAY15104.1 TetR family transcriptional regulator [Anabaenopsis circularis NIES-21]BBD60816.1 TetR family transcriptional regulator [Nostoc sp. HK-01]GBE91561.1 TetR family transcriptional regulator [Nostoc cycadae WK-1]